MDISVTEFKRHCLEIIRRVEESGKSVAITRRGKVVARLNTNQLETIDAAVNGCAVIVGADAHQYAAPSVAERMGIGCVTAV